MWNELIFILSIISGFGKKLGSSFENNELNVRKRQYRHFGGKEAN